jgi:hypothetical protein
MPSRSCVLAMAILLVFPSTCVIAQSFYNPMQRTEREQPIPQAEEIVVRGQGSFDEASEEPLIDESFSLESDLSFDEFQPAPLWKEGNWFSEAKILSMNRSNSMFGLQDRWGDFVASTRYTLGWEHESGVGVQGEFWHQEDTETSYPYSYGQGETTVTTLDIGVYKKFRWEKTELTLGTGIKGADLESNIYISSWPFYFSSGTDLEGIGVSLFGDARRTLYANDDYDIALVAEGRASALWGDMEGTSGSYTFEQTQAFNIYEAAIGVESRHKFKRSIMYIRGQYETQLWNLDGQSTIGFTGTSASVGITW